MDLSDSNLNGKLTMQVFGNDREFINLQYVSLNDNNKLNVSIDFEFLTSSEIDYFDIRGVIAQGKVDFGWLGSSIVIKLDTSVFCVDSVCSDNTGGKTVSWTRNNDTCVGKNGCSDTCKCVTEYKAGIFEYSQTQIIRQSVVILTLIVGIPFFFVCFGLFYNSSLSGRKQIGRCKKRDDFKFSLCFGFLFQLWDFFSDIFLCFDMFDHFYQESVDSPDKLKYAAFLAASATFIVIPWFANLLFLVKSKPSWESDNAERSVNMNGPHGGVNSSRPITLIQSKEKTQQWLNKNAPFLVLLCMTSGGLTPSLQVVNSKLLGLNLFDMGLPKYKQDETSRHKIWLTVFLENVPQIIISVSYASILTEFDQIVLFALLSSIASVILAVFSACLAYPKHYYIYQFSATLMANNSKIRQKIRFTNQLNWIFSDSLDQDFGFCFIENVYYNGYSLIAFNVVCNQEIDFQIRKKQRRAIIENFSTKGKISIRSFDFQFICYKSVYLTMMCFKQQTSSKKRQNSKSKRTSGVVVPGMDSKRRHLEANLGDVLSVSKSKSPKSITSPDTVSRNTEMVTPRVNLGNIGNIEIVGSIDSIDIDREAVEEVLIDYNNWESWTERQVSKWVENVLKQNLVEKEVIEDFVNE